MKRTFLCLILLALVAACSTPTGNIVYQTSTIDALLAAVYDGEMTCRDLLRHGDFGIGTFNGLDGEMVVLDGKVYQVKSDGKVYAPDVSLKTPFATVCTFDPGDSIPIAPGSTFETIKTIFDKHAPNQNLFCAIKIEGTFKAMQTRSVPSQKKPYPPLSEVAKTQPVFTMKNISGTIVGFRCPAYVKGINVPGYHLHFLSDDRARGGHILSFETDQCSGRVDTLNKYFLCLPSGDKDFADVDLGKDRSKELYQVER